MRDIFEVPNDIKCILATFYHDLLKPMVTLGELSIHSREVGRERRKVSVLHVYSDLLKDMRAGEEGGMLLTVLIVSW